MHSLLGLMLYNFMEVLSTCRATFSALFYDLVGGIRQIFED